MPLLYFLELESYSILIIFSFDLITSAYNDITFSYKIEFSLALFLISVSMLNTYSVSLILL